MNKKMLSLILLISLSVSGCAFFNYNAAQSKPNDRKSICTEIKRKVIFYRTDRNMNLEWNSPVQQTRLLKEYNKYHCED